LFLSLFLSFLKWSDQISTLMELTLPQL
jgi:hypothetical protein